MLVAPLPPAQLAAFAECGRERGFECFGLFVAVEAGLLLGRGVACTRRSSGQLVRSMLSVHAAGLHACCVLCPTLWCVVAAHGAHYRAGVITRALRARSF